MDCARKARVMMQRKVLVSVVSIRPQFWPKASSVLKADAQSLLSSVPRGIAVSMQMQQLLMQPDNTIFFFLLPCNS